LRDIPAGTIVVDGRLVPEDLARIFAAGRQNPVDMLIGSNSDEGTFFVRGKVRAGDFSAEAAQRFGEKGGDVLALYPAESDEKARQSALTAYRDETAWLVRTVADWHAKAGHRTYAYFFSRVPPAPRPELGATHVADVAYMFDHIPSAAPWTDVDRRLAEQMSSYWVNFARTGDPNAAGLPKWPSYDDAGRVLGLGDTVRPLPETMPSADKLRFFDAAFERLVTKGH
jgi:para-nitrobenzyl esterase